MDGYVVLVIGHFQLLVFFLCFLFFCVIVFKWKTFKLWFLILTDKVFLSRLSCLGYVMLDKSCSALRYECITGLSQNVRELRAIGGSLWLSPPEI